MRRAILEKQKKVEELKKALKGKRTVMIANIEGVPAHMMQELRKLIKEKAILKVYKNVIIRKALEGSENEDLKKLLPYAEGHPSAIIISDEDPIKLYREITSISEDAPLRPGKPSPVDVVIEPGPVPVPITALSELKAAGIPVRSVKGAVEVEKEFVAVREGEIVDERLAKALDLMGIKPIKVFLRVVAAVSDGILFTEDVLGIKTEDVIEDIKKAASYAFNLAYNAKYPTKETVPYFLAEAHMKAINLAVNAGIVTKETAKYILARAFAQALSLASRLPPEALDEEIKEILGSQTAGATAPEEEEKEEKKEEEEKEGGEEEAAAGLASLFG